MKKMGLLPKLLIGIILGILIGLTGFTPINRVMVTFSGLFRNFLSYVIPLIIIGFIVPGIAELGGKAGKLLGITVAIAYISTLLAGIWGWAGASLFMPMLVGDIGEVYQGRELEVLFSIEIAPIMGIMTALITAFILGIGITAVKGNNMLSVFQEFQAIIKKVIEHVFLPLLPFHIAGIFAEMAYSGEIAHTLVVYGVVFLLTISLDYVYIAFQYLVASIYTKQSPFETIKKMLPAYTTALGTQSSAATIPVTTRCMKEIEGIDDEVAEFVAPLGASTHLSGSTITLVSCAIAVLALDGVSLSFEQLFPFIMTLGVTMVAAPGVPGGAIMAALGLLETMLGFTETQMSVMIAIYIAQDSFGTAANVFGDGAVVMVVNKIAGKDKQKKAITE
ncbi:MAG: dicarboxylate/amino acid:cation symporter [Turicibacter sp.]|nr:dicarboxylate/amino acid:cation symporter [Turicibacter sp.]